MQGLQKDSKIKETIEKIDEHTAIRYKVVEETIDLDALRREKAALEAQLNEKEPSEEELVDLAKSFHPHYSSNLDEINSRIKEIEAILNG